MKFEFSAGGIVFKKSKIPPAKARNWRAGKNPARLASESVTGRQKSKILILVSQHSQHHGWVFPKGLIGDHIKGEGKEETALREVQEETGVLGKILKPLVPVTYWYVLGKNPSMGSGQVKIKKTVYYYLMEYISGDIKDHDWEMENVEWLPPDKVEERLTYDSDKKVWKEAQKLL